MVNFIVRTYTAEYGCSPIKRVEYHAKITATGWCSYDGKEKEIGSAKMISTTKDALQHRVAGFVKLYLVSEY